MNVLIACEYSGIVRDEFIKLGHNAISCDILPTESTGPHIQGNVLPFLDANWDLIIAHPPCTAIAVSGNRYYSESSDRWAGVNFVWKIWKSKCEKICIENPVGVINSYLPKMPKPQYIQPWQFGHGETKKTGLWKRGLPDLKPTNIVDGREQRIWKMPPSKDRGKLRSLTFKGIAKAMATQWGTSCSQKQAEKRKGEA